MSLVISPLCEEGYIHLKLLIAVLVIFSTFNCYGAIKADVVIVEKSKSRLLLLREGEIIKEYHVAFGANPIGHKQKEGDERTPEGKYVLDYKKSDSSFYKAIHVSYPNEEDIKRASLTGVSPGGQIMIHGQKNRFGWLSSITQLFNWTNGCIAIKNSEMDEIWNFIDIGTPIEIRP